jgi:hypothetical protein
MVTKHWLLWLTNYKRFKINYKTNKLNISKFEMLKSNLLKKGSNFIGLTIIMGKMYARS